MKTPTKIIGMNFSHPPTASQNGAALVITLSVLVLLTILVVSLFISVTSERSESSSAANLGDSQRLAESVTSLVKSTISQAVSGYEADANGNPQLGQLTAWASQPGLIRTWKQDGAPDRSFRLYSSGNLVVDGALDLTSEFAELATWKNGAPTNPARTYNALWCDLNSPVPNQAGLRIYPITPPPADANSGSVATDPTAGLPTDNPATAVQEGIQGFSVKAAPGYSGSNPGPANNPLPMPVKWLYVLQDGRFISPGGSATVATVAGASSDNPIIGRVAYWTDDETSKVNLNTASEGVFWDVPYGINNEEKGRVSPQVLGYSLSVPVADEFQRLGGHPSFTSLSAVLGGWLPRPEIGFGSQGASTFPSGTSFAQNILPYYNLTPRIAGGGTEAGTRPTTSASPLALDSARLFASANELTFKPERASGLREINAPLTATQVGQLNFFLTSSNRAPETNLFGKPRIALWPIQATATQRNSKDRLIERAASLNENPYFFQRASEFLNDANPGSSQSLTADLLPGSRNEQLLVYLKDQLNKPVPGFGAAFSTGKSPEDINRLSVQAFDSIRSLVNTTSRALAPNYSFVPMGPQGGSFDDLVRHVGIGSVVPIRAPANLGGQDIKGHGRFPLIREVGILFYATDWKDETTLADNPPFTPTPGSDNLPDDVAAGDGSFNGVGDPQTSAMRAVVYLVPFLPSPGQPFAAPAVRYKIEGLDQLGITYNSVEQSLGFPSGNNSVLLVRPGSADISPYPDSGFFAQFYSQAGTYNYVGRTLATSNGNAPNALQDNAETRKYPFFGGTVTLDPPANPLRFGLGSNGTYADLRPGMTPTGFVFRGGTITVKVYSGTGTAMPADGDYIQSYTIDLPQATLPVPFIIRPNITASDSITADATSGAVNDKKNAKFYSGFGNTPMDSRNFESRMQENTPWGQRGALTRLLLWRGDVVRAVQWNPSGPSRADGRVIGGLRDVTAADFSKMPGYDDVSQLHVHGLAVRQSGGSGNINSMASFGFQGSTTSSNPHTWSRRVRGDLTRGRLVSSLNYTDRSGDQLIRPYVPASVNGVELVGKSGNSPGDWNSGIGNIFDGAFLNKGDEGYVRNVVDAFQNIYFPSNLGDPGSASALTSFSPTRQIASPVFFGSLALAPWRTLLFAPNPAAKSNHPGFGGAGPDTPPPFATAPDHLFLDNFWMPTIEPFAISEPSSTNGKVNLNFQIAPFTYLQRSTSLHAGLKALKIPALPNTSAPNYKDEFSSYENPANPAWRHPVDVEATIAGMRDRRFGAGGQGFRSASEISTVFLVPKANPSGVNGPSGGTPLLRYNNTANWWDDKLLTGDNLRESPYNQIYSRVTTQSNTYQIHYRVQALKQVPMGRTSPAAWGTWDEAKDQVVSELRGSTTIERYVDPNDPDIPDFALPANFNRNLADRYRWRTLEKRQFLP